MRQTWLAKKERKKIALRFIPNREARHVTTHRLFREGKSGERMMAVVLHHRNRTGKTYRLPTERDLEVYRAAESALEEKRARLREKWGWTPCRMKKSK